MIPTSIRTEPRSVNGRTSRKRRSCGPAPDPDQEVHRDQHHLPEHVEQKRVQADEHADHSRLENQEIRASTGSRADGRRSRREDREEAEHRGQQHEQHRDAVHPDDVANTERLDPRPVDDKPETVRIDGRRRPLEPEREADEEVRAASAVAVLATSPGRFLGRTRQTTAPRSGR